jgi:hypothetical protein
VLLPSLLAIVSAPSCPPAMQRHVLKILHAVLMQLGLMQGAFQRQVMVCVTLCVCALRCGLAALFSACAAC